MRLRRRERRRRREVVAGTALLVAAEAQQHLAEHQHRIATLEAMTFTDELTGLENRRGFGRQLLRTDRQFHWSNRGYGSFDDVLAQLASRKRKAVRRERRAAELSHPAGASASAPPPGGPAMAARV